MRCQPTIWTLMKDKIITIKYRFEHWMFKWTKDKDNDITFTVMGFINFTKYKEHTIIRFGRHYERAPKHVVLTY